MKNKIPVLFTVLLILTLSVFAVSDDETSAIPERGQKVQQMPQDAMPQDEFTPGQRPQGGRGQIPAEGTGDMPEQVQQTEPVQESSTKEENTTGEEQSISGEENQMPEMNMEGNMPQRGGFNPMEQGGFPFEQETQTTEETEKPYEKWITPIVSAVLLVFGFVFVALYKRKEY